MSQRRLHMLSLLAIDSKLVKMLDFHNLLDHFVR